MSCGLSVTDCFGQTVTLDHSNWEKHKPTHPEAVPYHDQIPVALADPDLVMEMPDGALHYYRLGLLSGRYRACYLKLVVQEFAGAGWKLKTVYVASSTEPIGTIKWMRRSR